MVAWAIFLTMNKTFQLYVSPAVKLCVIALHNNSRNSLTQTPLYNFTLKKATYGLRKFWVFKKLKMLLMGFRKINLLICKILTWLTWRDSYYSTTELIKTTLSSETIKILKIQCVVLYVLLPIIYKHAEITANCSRWISPDGRGWKKKVLCPDHVLQQPWFRVKTCIILL